MYAIDCLGRGYTAKPEDVTYHAPIFTEHLSRLHGQHRCGSGPIVGQSPRRLDRPVDRQGTSTTASGDRVRTGADPARRRSPQARERRDPLPGAERHPPGRGGAHPRECPPPAGVAHGGPGDRDRRAGRGPLPDLHFCPDSRAVRMPKLVAEQPSKEKPRPPVDRGGPRRASRTRVLVLWTDKNPTTPAEVGGGPSEILLNGSLQLMKARALAHVEQPEEFNRIVGDGPDEAIVMTPDTPREQVVIGSWVLAAQRPTPRHVWGHLSVRDPDGRGVWIKPGGPGLRRTRPENVDLLSWDGELLRVRAGTPGVTHPHRGDARPRRCRGGRPQ